MRRGRGTPINSLTDKHGIPVGLFSDPDFAHLLRLFNDAANG